MGWTGDTRGLGGRKVDARFGSTFMRTFEDAVCRGRGRTCVCVAKGAEGCDERMRFVQCVSGSLLEPDRKSKEKLRFSVCSRLAAPASLPPMFVSVNISFINLIFESELFPPRSRCRGVGFVRFVSQTKTLLIFGKWQTCRHDTPTGPPAASLSPHACSCCSRRRCRWPPKRPPRNVCV